MPRIRMLNDLVIDKIAAGEVVERPCAAIKELIENSLDAGAKAVTVEIRDGGISYFRVTDNGCGIPTEDIRMAFERHATSKITDEKDLTSVATLGFRGEALASIAAVGHVTCTTRTAADASGITVLNDGGTITSIRETACPEGTTIVVRDLFFNVPVRLKFLKKPSVEAAAVSELMARMILSRPDVAFRYISGGKTLYRSAGDGKLASALYCIYGRELMDNMRQVDGHGSGILLKGYVGIGDSARSSRSHESFFINGRSMRSQLLSNALEAACREQVMIGKYPVCALHLTMPYETVDVNVHPNKLEVRFQDEQGVYDAVYRIVLDALREKDAFENPARFHLNDPEETDRVTVRYSESVPDGMDEKSRKRPAIITLSETVPAVETVEKTTEPVANMEESGQNRPESGLKRQESADKDTEKPYISTSCTADIGGGPSAVIPVVRPVLHEAPAVSAGPDSPRETAASVRDQVPSVQEVNSPAADVKTNAEATAVRASDPESGGNGSRAKPVMAEQVESFIPACPEPVRLVGKAFKTYILVEYRDALLMIDQHAVHERLLFDRLMSAADDRVLSQELLVPIVMSATRREQALITENGELLRSVGLTAEIFGEHEIAIRAIPMILGEPQTRVFVRDLLQELENGHFSPASGGYEKKRSALLQTACKHAVKSGDDLSESEIRDLVEKMIDQRVTPTCPHGRPLVVALTRTEIDKRFKRIQG